QQHVHRASGTNPDFPDRRKVRRPALAGPAKRMQDRVTRRPPLARYLDGLDGPVPMKRQIDETGAKVDADNAHRIVSAPERSKTTGFSSSRHSTSIPRRVFLMLDAKTPSGPCATLP